MRILVCTDAAREGLNLQARCHDLIHVDLPWNPSRLEQRNGRIDRKLQPSKIVSCRYFIYDQREEDRVLDALVRKTEVIRRQLGAAGEVLRMRMEQTLTREGIRRRDAAGLAASFDDAQSERVNIADPSAALRLSTVSISISSGGAAGLPSTLGGGGAVAGAEVVTDLAVDDDVGAAPSFLAPLLDGFASSTREDAPVRVPPLVASLSIFVSEGDDVSDAAFITRGSLDGVIVIVTRSYSGATVSGAPGVVAAGGVTDWLAFGPPPGAERRSPVREGMHLAGSGVGVIVFEVAGELIGAFASDFVVAVASEFGIDASTGMSPSRGSDVGRASIEFSGRRPSPVRYCSRTWMPVASASASSLRSEIVGSIECISPTILASVKSSKSIPSRSTAPATYVATCRLRRRSSAFRRAIASAIFDMRTPLCVDLHLWSHGQLLCQVESVIDLIFT